MSKQENALIIHPGAGCKDLKGLMPENWCCVDCGFNTAPGLLSRGEMHIAISAAKAVGRWGKKENGAIAQSVGSDSEVYHLLENVWQKTGLEGYGGCLCIGCVERRIGRRLKPRDFDPNHPFNRMPGTERLLSRRGR
jgi:hypothetical protein